MKSDHFYQKAIRDALEKRVKKNPRYSLRAFSRTIEIDPSMLSRVINGQVIPTLRVSKLILPHLELDSTSEKEFIESVSKANKDKTFLKKRAEIKEILEPKTSKHKRNLTPDHFRIISDWYHYALLQLMETEDFNPDLKWIALTLEIKESEAKEAINRLLNCGFIEKRGNSYVRVAPPLASGDLSITTAAHRKRIRQVTEKSLVALENNPIQMRNHTTLTLGIDPDRIPLAKEMIQDFMAELGEVLQTSKKTVYELQVNLFPLQSYENQ